MRLGDRSTIQYFVQPSPNTNEFKPINVHRYFLLYVHTFVHLCVCVYKSIEVNDYQLGLQALFLFLLKIFGYT